MVPDTPMTGAVEQERKKPSKKQNWDASINKQNDEFHIIP